MLNRNICIYLAVIGFLCGGSYSHFDLFMNETETKRILGIPGSLFYVRNGAINDYALSFNLPIKSNVDEIYFSWQNLRSHPTDASMTYSLAVLISNHIAMGNAVASMPLEGIVPSKPSVFSISLHCTGLLVAEVDIRIQLNVTMVSASNLTILEIKRRKTCVKGHTQQSSPSDDLPSAEDLDLRSVQNGSSLYSVSDQSDGFLQPGNIFYIIIGSASGAIFLLGFALVIFYCRSSQNSSRNDVCDASVSRSLRDRGNACVRSDTPTSNSIISGGTYRGPLTFPYTELRPCDVESILTEIQLSRSHVKVTDILLEGTYGRVCRGTVTIQGYNSFSQEPVLIKTLTDQARNDEMEDMMRRGCLTRGADHENVAPVMAAVLDFPPLLIYSDSNTENLKKFLLRCRTSDVLNTHQLVCIAIQISRGLQHLHRRRILHRDLATRNCLVDSRLNVRICDSALSRDIFPGDYHQLGNGESRPVKWMAIESLTEGKYSTACDVWSFGVTTWELFTLGHQPYIDIDPFEMVSYLCDGFRLIQPLNCPNEIFQVMFGCWIPSSGDRLRLTQLQSTLQEFYEALAKYV